MGGHRRAPARAARHLDRPAREGGELAHGGDARLEQRRRRVEPDPVVDHVDVDPVADRVDHHVDVAGVAVAVDVAERLLDDAQGDRLGRPVEDDAAGDRDPQVRGRPVAVEVVEVRPDQGAEPRQALLAPVAGRRGAVGGGAPVERGDGEQQLAERVGVAGQVVPHPARGRGERGLVAERRAAGLDERHEGGVGRDRLLVELGGDAVPVLVGALHDRGEQLATLLGGLLDLAVEPPGLAHGGEVAERAEHQQQRQGSRRERHGPRAGVGNQPGRAEQRGEADHRGQGGQPTAAHLQLRREAAEARPAATRHEQRDEQQHRRAEGLEGDERHGGEREVAEPLGHLQRAVEGPDCGQPDAVGLDGARQSPRRRYSSQAQ